MRLPRFRVRALLIAVAGVAVLLGGGLEYVRLKRLSNRYRYYAWVYGGDVRKGLQTLARLKPKLRRLSESPDSDNVQIEVLAVTIEQLQAQLAADANLVQIYEHAASHPWEEPPQVVVGTNSHPWEEPSQVVAGTNSPEDAPLLRPFLTSPAPPAPPLPPELAPKPGGPPEQVPEPPAAPE
jgi:hypothetical protein